LEWVTKQKALVVADVAHCHTLERTSCAFSAQNNANYQQVVNSKIELDSYSEFVGIETCVRNIVFPSWRGTTPPVVKNYCPTYKCDSNQKECGVMTTNMNTTQKNSVLNTCTNSTGMYCPFTVEMVKESSSLNVSCTEKPKVVARRYNIIIKRKIDGLEKTAK
jgi:hypothetical protein